MYLLVLIVQNNMCFCTLILTYLLTQIEAMKESLINSKLYTNTDKDGQARTIIQRATSCYWIKYWIKYWLRRKEAHDQYDKYQIWRGGIPSLTKTSSSRIN